MRWMPNENFTHKLTADELRKGVKKSGEARRAKKSLREAMQVLMNADLTGKAADVADRYKQMEAELEKLKQEERDDAETDNAGA